MLSIKKILNTISNFRCEIDGKEIIFPGTLQEKEENINIIKETEKIFYRQ
mgnify:CR=1 FL=1